MASSVHNLVFLMCLIAPCMALSVDKDVTRKVRCTSAAFPSCFFVWKKCPDECRTNCVIDCGLCKPVCSTYI
ncbi:hypothetical protein QJS04_geneDACA008444 [Acorus gramineus]|uniref:Uncharacterized protein n=1 Tax=Acorus gramineus TaxID=55184 RepID=A0AAV9AIJ6_ACOGR|nr:hypothetical protein QJS04_geneDACA008444 [Acorus gramineus]